MSAVVAPAIGIAVRTLTSLVFCAAAAGKMLNWPAFQGVLANYRLLPEALVRPVAYALPPLESAIALGLLTALTAPWAEIGAALLLALFAAAMAVNLLRGRRHIDCGCFQSASRQTLRWALVARNVAMVLLLGMAAATGDKTADSWSVVNGLLAGGASFIILQACNTLWANVPAFNRPRAPRHVHSEGQT